MKNLMLLFFIPFLLCNCSTQKSISNGAYSDVSLNVNSDKFEINRLSPVEARGKAFWGIPTKTNKRQGFVVRFNGLEVNGSSQFLPILSLLGYTAVFGVSLNQIAGLKEVEIPGTNLANPTHYEYEDRLPLITALILSIPVAGTINNLSWSNSASKVAAMNLNRKLIEYNSDVDVFLNPKYSIDYKNNLWTQKATINANVMGAKLIIEKLPAHKKGNSSKEKATGIAAEITLSEDEIHINKLEKTQEFEASTYKSIGHVGEGNYVKFTSPYNETIYGVVVRIESNYKDVRVKTFPTPGNPYYQKVHFKNLIKLEND